MNYFNIIVLTSVMLSSGCVRTSCTGNDSDDEIAVEEISWTGYQVGDSGNETKFYLNGRYIGIGASGFNVIIQKINDLDSGSEVLIVYQQESDFGGRPSYLFPFEALDLDADLIQAAKKNKISIKLSESRDILGTIYLYRPTGSYFEE